MLWKWCGTPVSNRRPSAWQADALPTELVPRWETNIQSKDEAFKNLDTLIKIKKYFI
tara:strand:- start:2073 stop:2243 length:171 start_codon:yes stop_codon:yes gene_type:complete